MSRQLRLEFPGAVYHVMSRGNNKQNIFLDRGDNELLLSILKEVTERFNWLCHSYCLMKSHNHLLLETPEANLSLGMKRLNSIYAQEFNKKYNRVGHVFQGRYKAILVQKETYLLVLSKYIAVNPVKDGLVERPEDWPWSSYRATIGLEKNPGFLYTDWLLGQFREHRCEAIEAYKRFVSESPVFDLPAKKVKGDLFLGDEDFIEGVRRKLDSNDKIKKVVRIQRLEERPELYEIFQGAEQKPLRNEKIHLALKRYGFSITEISRALGVSISTVSKAMKNFHSKRG